MSKKKKVWPGEDTPHFWDFFSARNELRESTQTLLTITTLTSEMGENSLRF